MLLDASLSLEARFMDYQQLFFPQWGVTRFPHFKNLAKRRRTVRTEEAIATVERSIEEDLNESIRHRAQELDLCPSTLWKILRKNLGLRAYKIQLVQELNPNDHQARRRFVEWAQNEIAVVPDFHKRILFSDEAHFWLNGYVNKQNCRILSEANPQVYVETSLHPEKLTVWCDLWAGGIIGP
ncbi:putative transposable element [Trichonephila clavipes]|nr:putative transposable element [Trichonephila clavipes]